MKSRHLFELTGKSSKTIGTTRTVNYCRFGG